MSKELATDQKEQIKRRQPPDKGLAKERPAGAETGAAAVLRLATPVLKYRATRDARGVAGDALDMRGGCGYIEEWANPKLLRDAHLGSVWAGTGNIVADPLFLDTLHYHLKSVGGVYSNGFFSGGTWGIAATNSPCIDGGDPASSYELELRPRGGRINMGAYGNTPVASKTWRQGTRIMIR